MHHKVSIAGVDEVGMGCLAGPVVAAAVMFQENIPEDISELLDDSKKIKPALRQEIYVVLNQMPHVKIGVAAASVDEIFHLNIRKSASLAMQRAVSKLNILPDLVLVDGTIAPDFGCATQTIIKGDGFSYSIAAASIIAKVLRDKLMVGLARKWDRYGWEHNVGYPTVMHREALRKYGCSPHHRQGYITVRQFSFSMDVEQKEQGKGQGFYE
ncbi:ribonuclease HII [Commensalibacter melissae]|uniref:ribonuclease HII n=1 Tax=Commensalibacter melissae TaxID=2070537 RepID=UPI000EFADCDF|nr:ribonuclease HII [Commensalibacter melissae]AYN87224.1 ribonuclease HII [Commensalibacter melissae]